VVIEVLKFPLDSTAKSSYHVEMQASRLDDNTILLETENESIIVLYPRSAPPEEVVKACAESAARLEKKAKIYRDFCSLLARGTEL
jgi:hypothetical protein